MSFLDFPREVHREARGVDDCLSHNSTMHEDKFFISFICIIDSPPVYFTSTETVNGKNEQINDADCCRKRKF